MPKKTPPREELGTLISRISFLIGLVLALTMSVLGQPVVKPQTSPAQTPPAEVHARVTEALIDASITDDAAVDKMVAVYAPKVKELDEVIGKLKGELRKGGAGAGSLGNFVTDGMRAQAALKTNKPITLALVNGGGLRKSNFTEGELRARDIWELLPFENKLMTVDLTGEQLKRLLESVITSGLAQSGARIVYKTNADKKNETESVALRIGRVEQAIDPTKTYTIVTIDYLLNVAGSRGNVLTEGTNVTPVGLSLRDAILNYVKSETAEGRDIKPNLDGRFSFDRENSANQEARQQ